MCSRKMWNYGILLFFRFNISFQRQFSMFVWEKNKTRKWGKNIRIYVCVKQNPSMMDFLLLSLTDINNFFYLGKILDFGELTLVLTINSVFLLKITKIGQIWLFWSNIMDFGRNDGWDWKCGIWDKNYWVTVTKYGKWWVWGQKMLNLVKVNFGKLRCVLSKYEDFLSKYDGF